jgi:hypothetical protein
MMLLLFDVFFFALGLYLYLFTSGTIASGSPLAEQWRKDNGRWARPLSLAMTAIFGLNLLLRFF